MAAIAAVTAAVTWRTTVQPVRAGTAVREVARVNGASITSDRLDAAVAAVLPMESFHGNVSAEKKAVLRRQALDTLIDNELAYQEGVRQAVTVSDADVQAAWIEAEGRLGGARELEETLQRGGMSEVAARAEISRALTIQKTHEREVTAKCGVSDDDTARYFSDNPDRFVEPEQLHIHAITIGVDPSSSGSQWAEARERAEQARQELEAGASFEAAVLKYSTDASKEIGGDMGFVHRGSLSARFEEVAKDLPIGQFSQVIESLYGYHIIRVFEIRPAQQKTFDEVRAGLQQDLTESRCAERRDEWIRGLRATADVTLVEIQ